MKISHCGKLPDVSSRNASAFSNLGTLYLSSANGSFEDGIKLKIKFLESDFASNLKSLITDETFKISKKEIQLLFLNQLQNELEKTEKLTPNRFIEIISDESFSAKSDFLKGFVQKPIGQIEKVVDNARTKRKENKAKAITFGNNLYKQTSINLKQLKSILGDSDIKYTTIADKVADEILQCGIDYFKYYRDTETDPGSTAMNLFKKAKSLACGRITKQRIQENTENLQEWIDDKPERDKQKLIGDDLQFITSKLERFQNLSDTTANAKDLIDSCKPRLVNIKNVLGQFDDFYLKISSAVANNALGMLVTVVNEAQESIEVRIGDFSNLRTVVRAALSVSESIGAMDMLSQQKLHYSKNHSSLKSIASQLSIGTSSYRPSSSSSTSTYRPTSTSSSSSWASENPGCLILIIIAVIIFIISMIANS